MINSVEGEKKPMWAGVIEKYADALLQFDQLCD
jgi:hypothetical protein